MHANIEQSMWKCNRYSYLTPNSLVYLIDRMKLRFGERLRMAMAHARINQVDLAEKVGIKQPSVAYLLDPQKKATGSQYTPRFARVLGVSVDWLSDEIGPMIPVVYTTSDPKIIATAKVMESSPEYIKDAAVKAVLASVELADHATKARRGNGTEG